MGDVSPRWTDPPPVVGVDGWRDLGPDEAIADGDLFQSTIQTAIANQRWTRCGEAVGMTLAEARAKWPSAMGRVMRREVV